MYNKGDLAMKKTCNIIKKFGGGELRDWLIHWQKW